MARERILITGGAGFIGSHLAELFLDRGHDVIVMDNLRAHHDKRVNGLCAARGVEVMYLPPYSPDFNPKIGRAHV